MASDGRAEEALQELGLTEYEAKCFVALSRISQGTAKQISQIADVPRSRVYDSVERLQRRGLVNVQQSNPREFRLVERTTALEILREEYSTHLDVLDGALEDIEAPNDGEGGSWEITDHEHVAGQVRTLVETAEEEVFHLATSENTFEEELFEAFVDASERGVDVVVEVPEDRRSEVAERLPDATVLASELPARPRIEHRSVGRIVMADREVVLVSTLREDPAEVFEESALWSQGIDHGLVVTVRGMLLTWSSAFEDVPAEAPVD